MNRWLKKMHPKKIKLFFLLLSINLIPLNTKAAPPFLTDDPIPVDAKNWAVYLFSSLAKNELLRLQPDLYAPAIELDWGLIPDLELHGIVSYAWTLPNAPPANGLTDSEIGLKYRFIHETDHMPQISIAPALELPTGSARRNLGNGQFWAKLPVWMQKSWGPWTSYGGAGYVINNAPQMRNYFFSGWLIQRQFNEHIMLGTEIFYQDVICTGGESSTILDFGGAYNFNNKFAFLFSLGRSIAGQENTFAYLGFTWSSNA